MSGMRSKKGQTNPVILSRNLKSNQQQLVSYERTSDVAKEGHNSLTFLLTGSLTSRSSAAASSVFGNKKEIKCVITKQTKFNEERMQ